MMHHCPNCGAYNENCNGEDCDECYGRKKKMKENWKVITHLVSLCMSNHDGIQWGLHFSRFSDETRTAVHGKRIGYLGADGKIVVDDPSKHRVIFEKSIADYSSAIGEYAMIWLEKQEEKKC